MLLPHVLLILQTLTGIYKQLLFIGLGEEGLKFAFQSENDCDGFKVSEQFQRVRAQ